MFMFVPISGECGLYEMLLAGYLLDLTVIFSFVGIRKEDSCACRL